MRLIDADALKADYRMSDDCKDCPTGWKSCEYDYVYTKMDFCSWLDDAPTIESTQKTGKWIKSLGTLLQGAILYGAVLNVVRVYMFMVLKHMTRI